MGKERQRIDIFGNMLNPNHKLWKLELVIAIVGVCFEVAAAIVLLIGCYLCYKSTEDDDIPMGTILIIAALFFIIGIIPIYV